MRIQQAIRVEGIIGGMPELSGADGPFPGVFVSLLIPTIEHAVVKNDDHEGK